MESHRGCRPSASALTTTTTYSFSAALRVAVVIPPPARRFMSGVSLRVAVVAPPPAADLPLLLGWVAVAELDGLGELDG